MDRRLYVAACNGDVEALRGLLQEDRLVLSRSSLSTSDSPLHIAALLGHTEFAKLVISQNQEELSRGLNQQGYSPIHLASLKGHLQLKLTTHCFLKDSEGRIPLHCAAIKGRLDVITHLISCCPQSAQEVTSKSETVLHLVVKNIQTEAMKLLISLVRGLNLFDNLVNFVDEDENTVLQLAMARKQNQITKMLLRETKINATDHQIVARRNEDQVVNIGSLDSVAITDESSKKDIQESLKNGMIILCSLFATFCFDAVLNPPGVVWQARQTIKRCYGHQKPGLYT